MPVVRIDLLKGRTIEQKREMAKEITDSISRIAKTDAANVKIIFSDMEFDNYASGGKLTKDIIDEQK